MKRVLLMCMALFFGLSQAAVAAETVRPVGGAAMVKKVGPWYVFKTNYDDGSIGCEAVNFNHQNRAPMFMFGSSRGSENSGYFVRFEAKSKVSGNETVDLIIGNKGFKFHHPGEYDHNGFFPKTGREANQIVGLLKEQEKSDRKYFHVRDAKQKLYKFDARSTSAALSYVLEKCTVK